MNSEISRKLVNIRAALEGRDHAGAVERRVVTEAEEIDRADLYAGAQKALTTIEAAFKSAKFVRAWRGIHGQIIELEADTERISASKIQTLAGIKGLRWVEFQDSELRIGI